MEIPAHASPARTNSLRTVAATVALSLSLAITATASADANAVSGTDAASGAAATKQIASFSKGSRHKRQLAIARRSKSRWRNYKPTAPAPAPAPETAPAPAPEQEPSPAPAPEPAPAPAPAPAPEPAPASSPLPNPVDVLFSGSRITDFARIQAAPSAITEVSDPLGSEKVLKMTVSDKDVAPITPTENPRAQALSPDMIKPGAEIWLSTKFMLPADFPSSVPGWMSLVEIYGAPFAGSSPWGLGIGGNQLSWQRNGSYKWDIPWQAPLVRGRWVSVLLHERFASDGWVEMWIDGKPVKFFASGGYNPSKVAQTERLAMKTIDSSNNGGANHAKIMNYREAGMFSSATVYFGALKVGSTRASVGG